MSPRELARECDVATERRLDVANRDIAIAWTVAALSRQERLPPLRTLLVEAKTRTQTAGAHAKQLAQLSEHLGVAFRPISPEAKAALERMKRES
jgi:hypothetical protein